MAGPVDLVVRSREVVADFLGHELFAFDGLAVVLDLVGAHVALGNEAVALGEPVERSIGGGPVGDEVVKGWFEHGEAACGFVTEVCLADAHVEA